MTPWEGFCRGADGLSIYPSHRSAWGMALDSPDEIREISEYDESVHDLAVTEWHPQLDDD